MNRMPQSRQAVHPEPEDAAARAGRREANLRLLNERIAAAHERAQVQVDRLQVVCECARDACEDVIAVPMDTFEQLRDRVDRFVVVQGHVLDSVEDVVERFDEWVVVQKRGEAAREAARTLD